MISKRIEGQDRVIVVRRKSHPDNSALVGSQYTEPPPSTS
jgi:hypothetical protein